MASVGNLVALGQDPHRIDEKEALCSVSGFGEAAEREGALFEEMGDLLKALGVAGDEEDLEGGKLLPDGL